MQSVQSYSFELFMLEHLGWTDHFKRMPDKRLPKNVTKKFKSEGAKKVATRNATKTLLKPS